jgi:hypothetical protein
MNGPQHYAEAERLLAEANEVITARWRSEHEPWPPDVSGLDKDAALEETAYALQVQADWVSDPDLPERNIAEARVHATLALAAAIAGAIGGSGGQASAGAGAITPGSTPAADPAHVPGSAVEQFLRELAQELVQELRTPPPEY